MALGALVDKVGKMPKLSELEFSRNVIFPVDRVISRIIIGFEGVYGNRTNPYRKGYGYHTGLDYVGTDRNRGLGQAVWAIADGIVRESSCPLLFPGYRGYGHMVIIQHPQFENALSSRYAHMQKRFVKTGEHVKKGQLIGLIGTSGTDNVHLHFDLIKLPLPHGRFFPRPGGFSLEQVKKYFRDPIEFFKTTTASNQRDNS
jgi:murein DD-endopeptidase MepM/ murein hydrolase activator NlpD